MPLAGPGLRIGGTTPDDLWIRVAGGFGWSSNPFTETTGGGLGGRVDLVPVPGALPLGLFMEAQAHAASTSFFLGVCTVFRD